MPIRRLRFFGIFALFCFVFLLVSGEPVLPALLPQKLNLAVQHLAHQSEAAPPDSLSGLTQRVQKTMLSNGLTVLTKAVNTAPVVTVQVWYRVGSRDEATGLNGITHQLEHQLFKGTQTRPIQFGHLFSALGSQSNAFTSYDMTAYFGTVGRDQLTALLTLEADRMHQALIDGLGLESEKRVVISELQGYENSPDYRLNQAVMRAAFPDHPYGLPVGGTQAEVEGFTLEQVRDYYRRFYRPDNAILVIVGDFEPEAVLKTVEATFGQVAKPVTPLPEPQISSVWEAARSRSQQSSQAEKIVLREAGNAALLDVVYPLPAIADPDIPALQVLDYVLASGRSSRLYQQLVETGLASNADGYAIHLISGGWYEFSLTAMDGQALDTVEAALQKMILDVQTKGILNTELERAKTQLRAAAILQNRDITSQAMQLGEAQITAGDYRHIDRLLQAIAQVTARDVQRVAQTYLAPQQRTTGWFEPTTMTETQPPSQRNFGQTSENFSPGAPVDPAEVVKYLPTNQLDPPSVLAQALPQKRSLPNGLQFLLLPDTSTPTVTLSGFIHAGTSFDKPQKEGLAWLTAENLLNGSNTQTALEIAQILENRGASLEFATTREGVYIAGEALASDLPTLLQVLGRALQTASFPEMELNLTRQQALTDLKLEGDSPERLARRVFQQAVYPQNHPFHRYPTEQSLTAITHSDILAFYRSHYRPEATTLTLVGDFDPAMVTQWIAQQFGDWRGLGEPPSLVFPPAPLPPKVIRLTPTLPGKTQAITLMGYSAIHRRDPRYYAALVLNQILGGDTLSSRLGSEIRDRQGLTYGIYSHFIAGREAGPFLISMQTAPEDAPSAIASTLAVLRQLRDQGVSATEVTAAVRSLTNSYPVDLADTTTLAQRIATNAFYGLTVNELRQYNAKIAAVTPSQVNQVIRELLQPDHMVIVTVGPPLT